MVEVKTYCKCIPRIAAEITILVLLLLVGDAYATTITVDDSGGANFLRIQDAINNADAGDTIVVYSGTYYENVNVSRRLTLRGVSNGGGAPLVDARGSGSPITISADGVTVDGFFVTGSENNFPNAGIYVQSNNSIIVNNTATNNYKGIYLYKSNSNIILSNNISFNRNSDVSDGMYIEDSDNNNIINNTVTGNRDEGIQLISSSDFNTVTGNTVRSNGNTADNTGIDVSGSSNNLLYHNNLIDNSRNANDAGNNVWNSGTEGNYWSDYTGIDANGDGIGDTPYSIQGGASKDNYPFMRPNGWLNTSTPNTPTPTTPAPTVTLTPTSTPTPTTPIPTPVPDLNSMYTSSSPRIDGTLSTGEWSNKISITLNGFDNPSRTKRGDLYIMNDNSNIYVAAVIPDTRQDADYLMLDFDNGNDHTATIGKEDAAGFNVDSATQGYQDYYWGENWWTGDSIKQGSGAMRYSNGVYTYEFSKPLNSGDSQDMVLRPGDLVGFRIETWDDTLSDYYRYPVNTVDAITSEWNKWSGLATAVSNSPVPTPTMPTPTPTSTPTPVPIPCGNHDINGNGRIERNEAVQAVIEYFNGGINKQEAIEVVIGYFSGSVPVVPQCTPPAPTAIEHINKGESLIEAQNYSGALSEFDMAIALEPNSVDAHIGRGNANFYLENYSGAISDYTKVIALNPISEIAYIDRGVANSILKNYSGAISDFTKAISLEPNSEAAYMERGYAKYWLENYSGAISDYTKAIALNPNYERAYLERGVTNTWLENYSGAISDFTKAIALNPNSERAYLERGRTNSRSGNFSVAISDFTKAISLNPNSERAYLERGYANYNLENYSGSIPDFSKVIAIDPANTVAYDLKAWSFYELNDYDGAILDSTTGINYELSSSKPSLIFLFSLYAVRAFAHRDLGQMELASEDAASALRYWNYANAITLSGSASGSVSLKNSTYYKFYVNSSQQVTVILDPNSGDQDLTVYDPNQNSVGSSNASGTAVDRVTFRASSSGYYYARVYGYAAGRYTISVSGSAAMPTPTPTPAQQGTSYADAITLSGSASGSVSLQGAIYYKFYVNNRQQFTVTLSPGSGDQDLTVYDSNQNSVDSSRASGTTVDRVTFAASISGYYYAKVYGYAAGSYTISVSASTAMPTPTATPRPTSSPGCQVGSCDVNSYYSHEIASANGGVLPYYPPPSWP